MSLQKASIIVSLAVSQWTARKHDKKITDEVNTQHNAKEDAGRYNKLLVSKNHLDTIQRVANKARTFHYENTLSWGDNNERLLPAENYFTYIGEVSKMKSEFDAAVKGFLKNYDKVIEEAKVRLNGMFNPSDYPTKLEIESKFGFRTTFMPVPETDIRVALSKEEVKKIRQSVEDEMTNRLTTAVAGIWERIYEQLKHMKQKLSDSEAIFRDSLFSNLTDLLALIPKLNVTKDVNIAKICNEMSGLVAAPDDVRNNPQVRSEKAKKVDAVLSKFGAYFNK